MNRNAQKKRQIITKRSMKNCGMCGQPLSKDHACNNYMINTPSDTDKMEIIKKDPFIGITITEESFISKYGSAAERLLVEVRQKAADSARVKVVEEIREKINDIWVNEEPIIDFSGAAQAFDMMLRIGDYLDSLTDTNTKEK